MPLPRDQQLRQFLLFAFALIIPCFVLWTLAASFIAMPAVGLADMVLRAWFPQAVDALMYHGKDVVLMTEFGELNGTPVPPEQSEYQLAFAINPGIVSYSLPFYATLHFATPRQHSLTSFVSGVLLLYPWILVGLLMLCMKELMVTLGPLFMEQQDVWVPHGALIALFYQLNVLIVPTLAPVCVWAWQSRDTAPMRALLGALPVDASRR
jgi:hypothetical protein